MEDRNRWGCWMKWMKSVLGIQMSWGRSPPSTSGVDCWSLIGFAKKNLSSDAVTAGAYPTHRQDEKEDDMYIFRAHFLFFLHLGLKRNTECFFFNHILCVFREMRKYFWRYWYLFLVFARMYIIIRQQLITK